jgi:hypothetical protein
MFSIAEWSHSQWVGKHLYPMSGLVMGILLTKVLHNLGWAPVAHACNHSCLGNREDQSSNPAWTNSFQDPISKITRAKWIGGMAQAVECFLWKHEAWNSNPSPTGKKKITKSPFKNIFKCPL